MATRGIAIKEMIERTEVSGDDAESLKGALREYEQAVNTLERVLQTKDPTLPAAAHAKRNADASKRLEKFVHKADAKFMSTFNSTMRNIRQRIEDEANLRPTKNAPEIRAALLSMDGKRRLDTIQTAFRDKNAEVLAAIREGPAMLSGLDDQTRDAYVMDYEKTYAPEATAEADAALELFELQGVISKVAKDAAAEAVNPAEVKQIDDARDAAKAADSDFSESVKNEPAIG